MGHPTTVEVVEYDVIVHLTVRVVNSFDCCSNWAKVDHKVKALSNSV